MHKDRKNQAEAITQILILVIGIVAISWMLGSELKEVSAFIGSPPSSSTTSNTVNNFEKDVSLLSTAVAIPKNLKDDAKTVSDILKKAGIVQKTPIGNTMNDQVKKDAIQAAETKAGVKTGWMLGGESVAGQVISTAVWAAIAFAVGRYILGPMLGLSVKNSQALGWALGAGTAAGLIAFHIIGASAGGGPIGLAIGAAVAAITFVILYKNAPRDVIQVSCSQWDAQTGKGLTPTQMTDRCKKCNDQALVCTEYQCRSLGQGCVLINDESSGKQLCIWNNTQDITPPIITTWKDALLKDFSYTPDNTISPPDKGVKVTYTGSQKVSTDGTTRCAPPFTPVSFGVQLNEPARCKISTEKFSNYSDMPDTFMGSGIRDYNQSFALSLPSAEAMEAENLTVDNGGKYQLYVRCEDANGNANIANFVFKFCISQGPDTTPPLIAGTSILDKTPIAYNQTKIPIELYVTDQTFTKQNSSCRWSRADKDYNSMEGNMSCTHSLLDMNAQLAYTCSANLTGLKDNQDNKFYFRCVDDLGNVNTQSYPLTLIGTQPLSITSLGPTGTVEGSSDTVDVNLSVETAKGYDEGKAVCSFSETGKSGSYIDFFYGYDVDLFSQSTHSQELGLGEGNYTYFISCRDQGGNTANGNISFSVKVDTSPPLVVRVYKDEELNALKIITDEPAECVYSNSGCNYPFDTGTVMNSDNENENYVDWNSALDFYIKCEDNFGNMPPEGECSIIARPFDIVQTQ